MNASITTIDENLSLSIANFKDSLSSINSINADELQKIYLALELGQRWHHGQKRDTGDWYFIHPVRVAQRCLEYLQDPHTLISALLHDVLEDCPGITSKDLKLHFGDDVTALVQALTKFKKESRHLSVGRILKLALKDSRVLLIKIIDRLDNLSDMHRLARSRQRENAAESVIFANVAEAIGLTNLAIEIRNLSFSILYPSRYKFVQKRIGEITVDNNQFYSKIEKDLWDIVGADMKCYKVFYELKTPFDFANPKHEIINILKRFYILMDSPLSCYLALGQLHSSLPVIPSRFHDYIANPLANDWQGLSTTLICQGITLEVWITSMKTYAKNQYGIYGSESHNLPQSKSYQQFITRFSSLFSDSEVELEDIFRNQYRSALYSDEGSQLQISTPKGRIIQMYLGASALDFAYSIHSDIGNSCAGAVINEKFRVEPSYQLQEGNIVDIITDRNVEPDYAWLNSVIMPHSRKEILGYLRRKSSAETNKKSNLTTPKKP